MRFESCGLFVGQSTQSEKLELFIPNVVAVGQLSTFFNASIALRMRVLIVPRGCPVFWAISECDMPSK